MVKQVYQLDRALTGGTSHPALALRSAALRSAQDPQRQSEPWGTRGPIPSFAIALSRALQSIHRRPGNTMSISSQIQAPTANESKMPPFADLLEKVARGVGLEPALLAAVVEVESSFDPHAVSRAGAKGLMQLMQSTALSLGIADVFDPEANLLGGARLLRGFLDRYGGSLPLALAAYNAGPAAVDRHGGIPPFAETRAYIMRVLAALEKYRASAWGIRAGAIPIGATRELPLP